jgi:hypothetical protein
MERVRLLACAVMSGESGDIRLGSLWIGSAASSVICTITR